MPEEATAKILPLGERLKQHRTERGLSQAQAARELDVARTAYRLWEMEAAKPSPDRWRLIARWLGVSISTMLLAEDLIDAEGADAADDIAGRTAGSGEQVWDDLAASSPGDFFEQERATIARQTRRGVVTDVESERLTASLERLQTHMKADIDQPPPGTFRKELVGDSHAPELARAALLVTAAGAPDSIMDAAELLTSGPRHEQRQACQRRPRVAGDHAAPRRLAGGGRRRIGGDPRPAARRHRRRAMELHARRGAGDAMGLRTRNRWVPRLVRDRSPGRRFGRRVALTPRRR